MILPIIGLVLWAVLGGAAVIILWVMTVYTSVTLVAYDRIGEAVGTFLLGIITALIALCIVVINVIEHIVQIVQIATNGG